MSVLWSCVDVRDQVSLRRCLLEKADGSTALLIDVTSFHLSVFLHKQIIEAECYFSLARKIERKTQYSQIIGKENPMQKIFPSVALDCSIKKK